MTGTVTIGSTVRCSSRAAKAGIYALQIDEKYGGAGEPDYRYRMVVSEEIAQASTRCRSA